MLSSCQLPPRRPGPLPSLQDGKGVRASESATQKIVRAKKIKPEKYTKQALACPLSPIDAINKYANYFDNTDKQDLENYDIIYFIRRKEYINQELSVTDPDVFQFSAGTHVAFRYEQIETLGTGTFGVCLKCYDHMEHKFVALKIINKSFSDNGRIDIETSVLYALQRGRDCEGRAYILEFYDAFIFREHAVYVTEVLASNLYSYIKSNKFLGMELVKAKSIGLQLAQAIQYIHQCGIIHSDIKPENILFTDSSFRTVKIIDFGSSCFDKKPIYKVVQSLYYRAPEVIFGFRYGKEIDTWSFACVLFEMVTGHPLFAVSDENSLIQSITNLLGNPPLEMINKSAKMQSLYECKIADRAAFNKRKQTLVDQMLRSVDQSLSDLISSCLEWLPSKRIKINDIVEHPFFSDDF